MNRVSTLAGQDALMWEINDFGNTAKTLWVAGPVMLKFTMSHISTENEEEVIGYWNNGQSIRKREASCDAPLSAQYRLV